MNNNTEFGIGTVISLLIGVIALIITIPMINNIVDPPEAPLEEYHLRFGYNDYFVYTEYDSENEIRYNTNNGFFDFLDGTLNIDFSAITFETSYYTLITIIKLAYISLTDELLVDSFIFGENAPYGIYDFSSWVVVGSETIIPVYTPF